MIDIVGIIFFTIIFIISIGMHEYAHALASDMLGDPTPRMQGRLTPNPLAHIDILGFLAIFLIHFGRGKPVITNPMYYKNRLRDELIVSMVGPFTNLIMAIFGVIVVFVYGKFVLGAQSTIELVYNPTDLIILFWNYFAAVNIGLAIFNALPIPPLDGYRIVKFLNPRVGFFMEQNLLVFTLALFFMLSLISHLILFIQNSLLYYIYSFFNRIFF